MTHNTEAARLREARELLAEEIKARWPDLAALLRSDAKITNGMVPMVGTIRAISRALGDRTEREMIVEWLRTKAKHFDDCGVVRAWIEAYNTAADDIASGAHLKDMG